MASQSIDEVYNLIMGTYEHAKNAQSILSKYTQKNDDTKTFLTKLLGKLLLDLIKLGETESDDYWKVLHFVNGINSLLNKWP